MEVGRITATLGAEVDDSEIRKYEKHLDRVKRDVAKRDQFKAKLGANYDQKAYNAYLRDTRRAEQTQDKLARSNSRLSTAFKVGGVAVAGAGVGLGILAKAGMGAVDAFQESEKVARRQSLVIKTMGQDAGATAGHVAKLASSMMRKTGVDDDAIISAANVVRTFKNIRNEAGEGGKVFDRTTRAALDLSAAFGTDLQSAAIQLGKALDNPAKGAAALSRTGAIAKDDVEKLKKMAEDGVPILKQQQFVLAAVERQVKGTAASNATASDKMRATWGELQEAIGEKLAPTFDRVAKLAQRFVAQMIEGRGEGGRFVEKLKAGFETLREALKAVYGRMKPIVEFFAQHPKFIGVAIAAFTAYKVAAAGAAAYAKLQLLSVYKAGPLTAAATTAGAAAGTGFGAKAAGLGAKLLKGAGWVGVGTIIGDALGLGISSKLNKLLGKIAPDFAKNAPEIKLAPGGLRLIDDLKERLVRVREEYGKLDRAKPNLKPLNQEIATQKREINGLVGRMVDLDRGSKDYKQTADRLKEAQANLNAKLGVRGAAGDVSELRQRLGKLDKGSDEYRSTARKLLTAQDNLNDKLKAADAAGQKGATGVRRIGDAGISASSAVASASSTIWGNVKGLADSLGGTKVPGFTPVVATPGQGARLAGGGWVGSRGQAGRDEVPAMLGRGEAVLNRHQQGVIEGLLGNGFLDSLFARVQKPHYLAAGGKIPDVTIGGPAGGWRNASNGATGFMDKIAEKFAATLAPKGMKGFDPQVMRAIAFARANGWSGTFSPLRSYAEQVRLYREKGPKYAAVPGTSNHGFGRGTAVDVTDPEGFAQAMANAPADSRLRRGMSWEPWHFSITGFAKGGWVGKSNRLFQSGRGIGSKTAKGLSGFEGQIADLERAYGQDQRKRGMDNQDFIVETDEGAYIDNDKLKDQTDDLGVLMEKRQAIRDKIKAYRQAVNKAVRSYETAIKRLTQARDRIPDKIKGKGKKADKLRALASARRARYTSLIGEYQGRRSGLQETARDLMGDQIDAKLDIDELRNEIKSLDPAAQLPGGSFGDDGVFRFTNPADPDDDPAVRGAGSGSSEVTPGETSSAPESVVSPPSPADIAAAAMQHLANFSANRAALFSDYGSNTVRSGSDPFSSVTGQAAGMRYFGAAESGNETSVGRGVVVNQRFDAPPPDPHTWSRGLEFELRQAI